MGELYKINSAQSNSVEIAPNSSEISIVPATTATEERDPLTGGIETASSDLTIENRINAKRMQRFKANFSARLLRLLKEQDFEYGVDTPADELVRECFKENESVTKEWLNQLFVESIDQYPVLIGILRVLSHFEYEEIFPQGPTIALAALVNSNAEVRECGIRAFENWGTIESLEVLKNTQCEEDWLKEYLQQVIIDLEEELENNVAFDQKNRQR